MQIKNYFSNMMTIILMFTGVLSGLSNHSPETRSDVLLSTHAISGLHIGEYPEIGKCIHSYNSSHSLSDIMDDCLFVTVDFQGDFCSQGYVELGAYVLDGVAPFTYLWNTGETSQSFICTEPGTYCVTVTDSQGCSGSFCMEIAALYLSVSVEHTTCGNNDGTATVSVLNMRFGKTYQYLWNNGGTTKKISYLSPGTYTVTVTSSDGCSSTASIEVEASDPIILNFEIENTFCSLNNGSILVTPEVEGTYSYEWSNGAYSQLIADIYDGTYTVTVTNESGCVAIESVTINNYNSLSVTNTHTDTSCGLNNGSITTNPEGNGTFYYEWSNGATTQTISNLSPGDYTLTVTSDAGCEVIATSTIDSSGQIVINTDIIHTSCGLDNGSIIVNPTNSHGFNYLWSTGDTTQALINLEAGNYTITVTAVGGCTKVQTITVNESSTEIEVEFDVIHTSCGLNDGTITANPIENLEFTYSWSTGDTTQLITALAPGNYTVTVSANGGCSNEFSTTIHTSNKLIVTNEVTHPQCSETTGSILAEPNHGNTFTYNWSNGDTTQMITELEPGEYTVIVTNDEGCTAMATSIVLSSKQLTLTVLTFEETCDGCNDASLTALANGNAPYTYEWSNGATTQSIDELEPGVYFVTVTDDIGCSKTEVAVINRLGCEVPTLESKATDAPCHGENGIVTVNVSGGAAPYSYDWSTGENTSEVEVPAGFYYVIVTDSLECIAYTAIDIDQPEAIIAQTNVTDEVCYGDENGTIEVEVSGDFPPYTYDWSHGATENTLTGLAPDDYTATITDTNGCTTTITVEVRAAESINVPVNGDTFVCFGAEGSLEVAEEFAQYEWSGGETTQTITWTESGDYTVTVTDNQGCTGTTTVTTTVNEELGTTIEEEDGKFTLVVNGGTAPYTYLWSTGEDTETIEPESAGTYTVTISDSKGCIIVVEADFTVSTKEQVSTLQVHVYPNPASNILYIALPESDGESTITIYDGAKRMITEQRVTSAGDVLKTDISQLVPGTYILQVQNNNGYFSTKVVKQ